MKKTSAKTGLFETKGELIVTALVVSALVHLGVMLYARPKVMTHVAGGTARPTARAPMRVTKATARPEPARIEAFDDQAAAREAPRAETPAALAPQATEMPDVTPAAVAAATASEPPAPKVETAAPVFDAAPVRLESVVSAKIPQARIETPTAAALPAFAAPPPTTERTASPLLRLTPSVGTDPDSAFLPTQLACVAPPPEAPLRAFEPAQEVYEKVDEQVVAAEKAAVKALVESDRAADLPSFVHTVLTRQTDGDWTYFKVMVSPRTSLAVVPKDLVVLLDASGSIGSDRIVSIRKAAKRILRQATNTGDRFNLVAFRDRFAYAFRAWQDCSQTSFDRADRWLNNLAAHGRTDVFATISSVLTLPRDPSRPLIALVVTDGDANAGVRANAEILSKFTALNDGLVSVYMYGVKASANRVLLDALTRGNRGESFVFDGWRWQAGEGIDGLSERFRDPVLSDLRVIFSADSRAEAYPRVLKNLYRGGTVEIVGRVPAGTKKVAFALRGLNGAQAYEGFFSHALDTAAADATLAAAWRDERAIDATLRE